MKYVAYVIGAVVALFVVFAIIGQADPQGEAKSKARAGIELCWKEYERKSLTEAEKRFIASTCEMMEQKFVDTYRVKP
jgi:hypothetical protein